MIPENIIAIKFSTLISYKIKIIGIIKTKLINVHMQRAIYLAKIILYAFDEAREFSKLPSSISAFINP